MKGAKRIVLKLKCLRSLLKVTEADRVKYEEVRSQEQGNRNGSGKYSGSVSVEMV